MRTLFATFVVLLVPFVSALPARRATENNSLLKIPLTKRVSLINSQGYVDMKALRTSIASTSAKIQNGLSAYQSNTGTAYPNTRRSLKRQSAGLSLSSTVGTEVWQGNITVGTPPQTFSVAFDTGSSDMFLPGPTCGSTCSGHALYQPALSTTAQNLNKSAVFNWGSANDSMTVEEYTDTVWVAGFNATQQTVGAANEYASAFESDLFSADGLVGLGFLALSMYGQPSLFQTLINNGVVNQHQFAFKMTQSDAGLTIGGFDTSAYTGELVSTTINTAAYWELTVDSMTVNDTVVMNSTQAIIDTGSFLIVGPPSSVQSMLSSVGGQLYAPDEAAGYTLFTFPCNAFPEISVNFGGATFPLSSESLNIGQVEGTSDCICGIVGEDISLDAWVFGDTFLSNVYSVFDVREQTVSFATLA